jgi:hypothetical protein
MPEADLLRYPDQGLSPADRRQLAPRLVHAGYHPARHSPAGGGRAPSALGHPGRMAGL